jgi:putative ABC transport system permease protein
MLTVIALRNLRRNTRRTALALAIVIFGTVALLLTAGFVRASFDGLSDAIIYGGLGHLEVAPASGVDAAVAALSRAGEPPRFDRWREAQAAIESQPNVRAAAAVIQFAGVAINGERSAAVAGIGMQPDRLKRMQIVPRVRSGSTLPELPPEDTERCLLGKDLATALGVAAGDTITIMVATDVGSLNAVDFQVQGLISTGFQELDARIVQIDVDAALRLLGTGRVTSLIVMLHDPERLTETSSALATALARHPSRLDIVGWEARAPFYRQVRGLYLGIFVFLGLIISLLVAMSTANTILMSLIERTREFGTLLATGTSRGQLALLIYIEANWLGVIGGVAGSAFGFVVAALLNAAHIKMPPPPAAVDPIDLAVTIHPADYAIATIAMMVVLTLAASLPVRRLFNIRIIDAISHV